MCWLSLLQGLHYELQNCPELKTLAKIMGCSISIGDFETKNLNAFSGIIPKASLDGYLQQDKLTQNAVFDVIFRQINSIYEDLIIST